LSIPNKLSIRKTNGLFAARAPGAENTVIQWEFSDLSQVKMRGLTIAVHFLVLARHWPEDASPVVVLVSVLIALVVGVLALLRKHDVGSREPQSRADLKRPMLTTAELRLIDFTSLPMSPASATNEEQRKIRVEGGARTWQFLVKGYSHTTTGGPVPRYMLYKLLREGDGLRLIRSLHNPYDANAIHVVSEAGELAGVDLGFVPREIASELAPLLDAGAEFYAVVERVAIDDQINGFSKLYVYLRMVSSGPARVSVPKVVGMTKTAATAAITGAGLVLGTGIVQSSSRVAAGSVIGERPVDGTLVNAGSAVNLVVSSGPARVSVPNAAGMTQVGASTAITGAGLVVGAVAVQSSDTVATGSVIGQGPIAGTSLNVGSAVNLVLSSGPAKVSVPNVVGMTQAAAITAIRGHGLVRRKRIQLGTVTTQSSSTIAAGSVISESPAAGTSVNVGSAVDLAVSSGPAGVQPSRPWIALRSVPNAAGMTQVAASTAITGAGLVVGAVAVQSNGTVAAGDVISQSPVAGTSVNVRSPESLVVCLVVSSGPVPDAAIVAAAPTAVQWRSGGRASEIEALGKLYRTFGLNPPGAPGHAQPVPTEPVPVKSPAEVVAGFAVPQRQEQQKTEGVQLDPALVEAKLKETAAVSALLASVFAAELVPAPAFRATTGGCVPALGEDASAFVRHLATRDVWSRGELERFASARALLLDGILDAINETALEACGALALEGDDPVEVDVVVLTALIERTVAS
jgi:beta-lactam-binding protein with PASTA domain